MIDACWSDDHSEIGRASTRLLEHAGRDAWPGSRPQRRSPGSARAALLEDARREGRERVPALLSAGRRVGIAARLRRALRLLRPVLAPDRRHPRRPAGRAARGARPGPPGGSRPLRRLCGHAEPAGAVASDGPVLIVVDDGHWVDPPSREALVFCARRIADEPIAMLVASRERPPSSSRCPRSRISGPAAGEEAAESACSRPDRRRPLAPAVAREVLALAGGNPLALVELPRALTPAQRSGRTCAAAPAAAPVRRSSPPIGGGRGPRPGRPSRAGRGRRQRRRRPRAALGGRRGARRWPRRPDRRRGRRASSSWRTTERGCATRSCGPVVLELMDRPSAETPTGRSPRPSTPSDDLEQRAWHLAEATVGPDAEVAVALEGAAVRAGDAPATRPPPASSSGPPPTRRPAGSGTDLLAAAQIGIAAGDAARAASLVDRLWRAGPRRNAARRDRAPAGILVTLSGSTDDAHALLAREARQGRALDPATAARMLASAGLTRAMAGRCREALRCIQEARRSYRRWRPVAHVAVIARERAHGRRPGPGGAAAFAASTPSWRGSTRCPPRARASCCR